MGKGRKAQLDELLRIENNAYDLTDPIDFKKWRDSTLAGDLSAYVADIKQTQLLTKPTPIARKTVDRHIAIEYGLWITHQNEPIQISTMDENHICNIINKFNQEPGFLPSLKTPALAALYTQLNTRDQTKVAEAKAKVLRRVIMQES